MLHCHSDGNIVKNQNECYYTPTMKQRIICCGNIAYDLISTQKDNKGSYTFEARPGGSVFNTSILLARLGMDVTVLAKSGVDFLGDSLLDVMLAERIDTRYVIRDKRIKTGLALATIDKKGNPSYIFYRSRGPETAFRPKDIPLSVFSGASVFHTGSAFSYLDHTFESTLKMMAQASAKGIFTTYDPNWREGRIKNKGTARKRIYRLISHADILKLSDTDALGITGEKTLSSSLKKIPGRSVVTLGAKGCFFWNGKKKEHSPAFEVKVVDTIGAGDGFMAGLIYRYCLLGKEEFWKTMPGNLKFASAVSAIVCTARGATSALKSPSQATRLASGQHHCRIL
jgi:fructokinase